jgi:hypothetical protein
MRRVLKPKHAEEHSTKESNQFRAWEVVMLVQPEEMDPRIYKTLYYVRARLPEHAATAANAYWQRWEKEDNPDTVDQAGITKLDDEDYLEVWERAQTFPHRFVGMKDNPSAFTYWEPGYGQEDGRRLPLISSIQMPELPKNFNKQ